MWLWILGFVFFQPRIHPTTSSWLGHSAHAAPMRYEMSSQPSPEVRFEVTAPLDSITGVSYGVRGSLTVDDKELSDSKAEIEIDLKSFHTGIDLRDEDLRTQFFETEKYPQALFRVTRFEQISDAPFEPGQTISATAVGTLALHGKERPMRMPLRAFIGSRGNRLTLSVQGEIAINFGDFNIVRPQRLFLKLGDTVVVKVRALFVGPELLLEGELTPVPVSIDLSPPAKNKPDDKNNPNAGANTNGKPKSEANTAQANKKRPLRYCPSPAKCLRMKRKTSNRLHGRRGNTNSTHPKAAENVYFTTPALVDLGMLYIAPIVTASMMNAKALPMHMDILCLLCRCVGQGNAVSSLVAWCKVCQ